MSADSNSSPSDEEYDAVLEEVLKTLRAEYRQDLPIRMEELQNALACAYSDNSDAFDHLKNAHVVVHRFAGTAGSYGFQNLSEAAQELDLYFKSFFQNGESIEKTGAKFNWRKDLDRQKISSLIDRMQICIDESDE